MLEAFRIVICKINKKRKIVFKNNFAVTIGLMFLFRLGYVECTTAVTLICKNFVVGGAVVGKETLSRSCFLKLRDL